MKKILITIIGCVLLISCGPSKEELEAREKAAQDSIAKVTRELQQKISENVSPSVEQYYSAMEWNLPTGKIVDFRPDDEVINTFVSAGGEVPDRQIYIQIQDETGKVSAYPVDYKTWLNLYEGNYLK